MPSDGTASWDSELGQATLETVNHRFGLVSSCDEIVTAWHAAAEAERGAAA